MLGEGFDLPQMKIAALHDIRQSLPITLQFIGRFTRSNRDAQLGNASLIANIANPPIKDELRNLYLSDADWNYLLPAASENAVTEEIELKKLISEFNNLHNSIIPFQEIRPALSAEIYRIPRNTWEPLKWKNGISVKEYEYTFSSTNNTDLLVIILGSRNRTEWGDFEEVQNILWDIIVVYWRVTSKYKHAYINSSLNSFNSRKLVSEIFGEESEKIRGESLFRSFADVSRLMVMNFGGRQARYGNISFKSFYGRDVEDGISQVEKGKLIKNNIFGFGYRNGEKTSIGSSTRGKIWSYRRGDLNMYRKWCNKIGGLIEDESINPDIVLQNTLRYHTISEFPDSVPLAIDWNDEIYNVPEKRYSIKRNNDIYALFEVNLDICNEENTQNFFFKIIFPDTSFTTYSISYFREGEGEQTKYKYQISKVRGNDVYISEGIKSYIQ